MNSAEKNKRLQYTQLDQTNPDVISTQPSMSAANVTTEIAAKETILPVPPSCFSPLFCFFRSEENSKPTHSGAVYQPTTEAPIYKPVSN